MPMYCELIKSIWVTVLCPCSMRVVDGKSRRDTALFLPCPRKAMDRIFAPYPFNGCQRGNTSARIRLQWCINQEFCFAEGPPKCYFIGARGGIKLCRYVPSNTCSASLSAFSSAGQAAPSAASAAIPLARIQLLRVPLNTSDSKNR